MKLFLFLVISCLALHNGKGAPRTAVYKFVKCNPEGDKANCITQKTPEMAWTPDLPAKLLASTAQYLEAEPEEGESPPREEEVDEVEEEEGESPLWEEEGDEMEEEETPLTSAGWKSPVETEESSGGYEGSAAEGETGSGESDMKLYNDGKQSGMSLRRLFPSKSLVGEAKPAEQELREDLLLQL
ncbi:LOW QUALITY PROTEIN: serglycin [Plectropomus leopardus]|uniref:LOW QUALITY PROTEIN: serglycin n=1 Tax=Plectropomus leopardus TaxID=160734 RepID=UPI001C4D5D40|nr:LOW QUALITY PROTEIN: serglycin [Plectropomus leopardus]